GAFMQHVMLPRRLVPADGRMQRVPPHTQDAYQLDPHDRETLDQVEQLLHPDVDLLVLLQAGDEQLDYREAREYYRRQRMIVEQGGDHSFVDFPRYLPAVLEFLEIL